MTDDADHIPWATLAHVRELGGAGSSPWATLARVRELLEGTTPGPWSVELDHSDTGGEPAADWIHSLEPQGAVELCELSSRDAALVAAAPMLAGLATAHAMRELDLAGRLWCALVHPGHLELVLDQIRAVCDLVGVAGEVRRLSPERPGDPEEDHSVRLPTAALVARLALRLLDLDPTAAPADARDTLLDLAQAHDPERTP